MDTIEVFIQHWHYSVTLTDVLHVYGVPAEKFLCLRIVHDEHKHREGLPSVQLENEVLVEEVHRVHLLNRDSDILLDLLALVDDRVTKNYLRD
jgi:hypothetical protein